MAALPDLQAISNALRGLSTEIPNLPNLPVLNVIASLETTVKRNDEIFKQNELILKNFLQLKEQFLLALDYREQRTMARLVNSTIRNHHATIELLITNEGQFPKDFPKDVSEIQNASETAIKEFLCAYKQPINGDLDTCKKRLMAFLGIIPI